MKRANKSTKANSKPRGFGVILERIDSNVAQIAEGHVVLDRKIDNIGKDLHEFKKETSYKFGVVLEELQLIRTDLKQKVDRDEFVVLEKRVMALEKQMSLKK